MGISALGPLKNDPCLPCLQLVHPDEGKPSQSPGLHQFSILHLSAHGHNLLKQLLHPMGIEGIMSERPHRFQLFLLPLFVKYLLSRLYLVISHSAANLHAPLVELHDFCVNFIQLTAQFQ